MTRFRRIRGRKPSSFSVRPTAESLEIRSLLSGLSVGKPGMDLPLPGPSQPDRVPNELLVQFKPEVSRQQASQIAASLGLDVRSYTQTAAMQASGQGLLVRVGTPANIPQQQSIDRLQQHPRVAFAEPNYIYYPDYVSNDPSYTDGSLWGMYSNDNPSAGPGGTTNQFGSAAEQAWRDGFIGNRGVYIGVIDTGIQLDHPDLAANIWVNPFEIAGDGIDNDGNGYADDINGWDFNNDDNSVYDDPSDDHGTHVAGTIGASGGNGTGVAGVNWNVNLISAKFFGANAATVEMAVRAFDYMTDLKSRHGINLVATNNSWSGGSYSQSLHDAAIRHAKADILLVAAASNRSADNDTAPRYPANLNTTVGTSTETAASYDAVIAVASLDSNGALSGFSSYGATTVDIGAAGAGVLSTVPVSTYELYDGTSMATPHVAGSIGLYASVHSTVQSAASIRAAILNSAVPTTSLNGKVATNGRLNVYNAIRSSNFIYLDKSVYRSTGLVTITVSHAAANTSPTVVNSISTQIFSTTESAPLAVTLTETAVNTGVFSGTVQLAPGAPIPDSLLQVVHGDVIIASYPALGLIDRAVVDDLPPTISNIFVIPYSGTADVFWTTDEPADELVRYGTSPGTLTQSVSSTALRTEHSLNITGLSPNTVYFYQVQSTDEAGNIAVSQIESFTTQSAPDILFVDDDNGAADEQFFDYALFANQVRYDTWNVAAMGASPTAADLANYKMVIWNTGYDFTTAILPSDESAISTYLDNGGRIYISGQDVFWSGVSANFQTRYLKVADYFDDIVSYDHMETGIPGHPIGRNLSLTATLPATFGSLFVDELQPTADAEGFLLHNDPSALYPFSSVSYRGDYAAGGFGMVFTTLPFESISQFDIAPNDSATVMRRIIEYLIGPLPGVIDIQLPVYGMTQTPTITVRDSAPNVDYFAVDTTTVEVFSSSELAPLTVVLTETDVDTGVFTGTFQLGPAPVDSADSILQVVHNDTIYAVLPTSGSFDTAIIDGLPPNASNIAATAHPTRANISWTTDEDSFEQILVGTSPTSLSLVYDGQGFGSSHLMTVSGLVPQTQYYYQIISTDALGNSGASEINSFVTTIAQPILVIDDDSGATTERVFTDALAANLFSSDSWDLAAENGQPLVGDLNAYRMVIWNTGVEFNSALLPADELAISTYLNNGGRIFISGQDVLFSGVSTAFRTNYLKVASYEDDVQTVNHNEVGVSGHPIGNGMNIPVATNADVQTLYVDAVTPATGATGFLRHGVSTASSSFSAVSYRGNYAAGGFGMVFSTVPLEAMSTTAAAPSNQQAFMFRVVDFLIGPLPAIIVSSPTATRTTEAGAQTSFTIVLNSQPAAWVYVPVFSSDTTEGAVSTNLVAFSTANWFVPQTVTVTGVNDFVDDGDIDYSILIGPSQSPDVLYNGIDSADISLLNVDDDTAGITVSPPSGTSTTETGGSITFVVRLDSEPLSSVMIPISSSDTTEGSVNPGMLIFNASNWSVGQLVTATGVDDTIDDGDVAWTAIIGNSNSSDPLYSGLNPADIALVNIDNDPTVGDTKFYVVNDSTVDRTYEYDPAGNAVENYTLDATNTTTRGIATNAAGTRIWVLDANRRVYVYNNSGTLQGSWTLGTLPTTALVEGIATNGTHLWVVDRSARRAYYYANAAARTSGTQTATANFALNTGNTTPKDVVFGSQNGTNFLWVVDDGTGFDRVFRYQLNGSGVSTGSSAWGISPENSSPTGITLDPSNGSMDIWICDSSSDRVYRYPSGRTSVQPLLADSFALSVANSNAQGIADPPPVSTTTEESFSAGPQYSTWEPAPAAARRISLFRNIDNSPTAASSNGTGNARRTELRSNAVATGRITKPAAMANTSLPTTATATSVEPPMMGSIDDLFSSIELQTALLN
jgi:hypothetical protein